MAAVSGAHVAKCDLVSLMVGEFPELEGEMGAAYAIAQGVSADVGEVIRGHYMPRGATDATAPTDASALVAMADRLDTLVGCFGIGQVPTGAADPYGLRRACLGVLRTMLDRGFDVRLTSMFAAAYDGYAAQPECKLDVGCDELKRLLGDFFSDRLRGLLADRLPNDAVNASLVVASDRPLDVRARASAIAALDADTRARVGEVFKRATNIASDAPLGEPTPPRGDKVHPSETALHDGYVRLRETLGQLSRTGDYAAALGVVAAFAPLLAQYFLDVYVMTDEIAVRENRLRLMRAIAETCATLARLELLGS